MPKFMYCNEFKFCNSSKNINIRVTFDPKDSVSSPNMKAWYARIKSNIEAFLDTNNFSEIDKRFATGLAETLVQLDDEAVASVVNDRNIPALQFNVVANESPLSGIWYGVSRLDSIDEPFRVSTKSYKTKSPPDFNSRQLYAIRPPLLSERTVSGGRSISSL